MKRTERPACFTSHLGVIEAPERLPIFPFQVFTHVRYITYRNREGKRRSSFTAGELGSQDFVGHVRRELGARASGFAWQITSSDAWASGDADLKALHLLEAAVTETAFVAGLPECQLLGMPAVENLLVVVRDRL